MHSKKTGGRHNRNYNLNLMKILRNIEHLQSQQMMQEAEEDEEEEVEVERGDAGGDYFPTTNPVYFVEDNFEDVFDEQGEHEQVMDLVEEAMEHQIDPSDDRFFSDLHPFSFISHYKYLNH